MCLETSSAIVEDVATNIGMDIRFANLAGRDEEVRQIRLYNFPMGSAIQYTTYSGASNAATVMQIPSVSGPDFTIILQGTASQIRSSLDSLIITPPPQTDDEFEILVELTAKSSNVNIVETCPHSVRVMSMADMPSISTVPIVTPELVAAPLLFNPTSSIDANDSSEFLSVRIVVPSFQAPDGAAEAPIGTLAASNTGTVTFSDDGNGVYTLVILGDTAQIQQKNLQAFLSSPGILFTPAYGFVGSLTGDQGIQVYLTSTEVATNEQLAPDPNAKSLTAIGFVPVNVTPVSSSPSAQPSNEPSLGPSVMPSGA